MDRLDPEDAGLSVGVLTGAGGTFCAGMDLKAFARGENVADPWPRHGVHRAATGQTIDRRRRGIRPGPPPVQRSEAPQFSLLFNSPTRPELRLRKNEGAQAEFNFELCVGCPEVRFLCEYLPD